MLDNAKLYLLILMYVVESKDELYYFFVRIGKKYGLWYLRNHYTDIDKYLPIFHNEQNGISLKLISTITQHESGVNQILKLTNTNLVTISDDCSLKLWRTASTGTVGDQVSDNDIKVTQQVSTETTTCVVNTGQKKELLVTGCHSGNIHIQKIENMNDIKTVQNAHQNLIRALVSLT